MDDNIQDSGKQGSEQHPGNADNFLQGELAEDSARHCHDRLAVDQRNDGDDTNQADNRPQ